MFFVSFCFFFFYKECASSPAPNIINIIEREREKDGGFDEGALTVAPANIIDNYLEREEREVERKGIVYVCVCGLLIICGIYLIFKNLFTPPTGGSSTTVYGLFGGIIGYTFAPIFGALTTHNNNFIGGSIAPHIGAELTIFNGLINALSCPRGGARTITIVGGILYCFNFDTGAAAIAPATVAVVGYNNILFGYNTEPPDGVLLATSNNDIEYGLIANPIGIGVEFLGVFNTPYCELGDFNHHFNVLNCKFEMEKVV